MSHTPFGYRIKGGKAVIDEPAAEKIRALYKNYLSGLSLQTAAKEAGIDTYHGTAKRLMENRHYLGDDFYRTDRIKPAAIRTVPVHFRFGEVKAYHDDPAAQAEYLYTLIEREER